MSNENVTNVITKLNSFLNQSGDYLKSWSNQSNGKSDDPVDYLPKNNLKCIEQILIKDTELFEVMTRLGRKLKSHEGNEDKQRKLTQSYVKELSEIIKSGK